MLRSPRTSFSGTSQASDGVEWSMHGAWQASDACGKSMSLMASRLMVKSTFFAVWQSKVRLLTD
eukprot:scaffold249079_cov13-Tisochrysis_lutea.AAC.1